MIVLELAGAGFLGALCRFLVDRTIQDRTDSSYPLGTFAVNLTGSLAIGVVIGASLYHGLGSTPTVVLSTGFLGAYTTLSTLNLESLRLVEDGSHGPAAVNVLGSLIAAVGAAALGMSVVGAL